MVYFQILICHLSYPASPDPYLFYLGFDPYFSLCPYCLCYPYYLFYPYYYFDFLVVLLQEHNYNESPHHLDYLIKLF